MIRKVAVVGSYNVDMTITTDDFPQPGETVLGKSLKYGHGGKGANQAVAAARSGASVSFLAKVGGDQYGQNAISTLADESILTQNMIIDPKSPTGMAFITVNNEGENYIVVISGANWTLSKADILSNSQVISEAEVLLAQLETPLSSVATAIKIAKKHGVKVVLNPAPAQSLDPELLKMVNILTPNRIEAEMLTGLDLSQNTSLPNAADKLHAMGVEIVLITLGSQGVFVSGYNQQSILPSMKVQVIDTVGAGDVFSGTIAAHYPTDYDSLVSTVTMAVAASGLSIQKVGAQTAIPHLAEVRSCMKDNYLVENL